MQDSCVRVLVDFLSDLRRALEAEGIAAPQVFMYDSVIAGGSLKWQNELNDKNSCVSSALKWYRTQAHSVLYTVLL